MFREIRKNSINWKKEHQYDWEKVEDSYEIKFPNDYKSFIEYYGEGE